MRKLLQEGFLISHADELAIANELLYSLEEWAMMGPKHMLTYKPVQQIIKQGKEELKEKCKNESKPLPATKSSLVDAICKSAFFKSNKIGSPALNKPNRKQERNKKILVNGIDIEDHEYQAAENYWENPEQTLTDLLENKIANCKKRFVEKWTKILMEDPEVTEIPAEDDDLIEAVVLRPDYKNRATRQAEADALHEIS